MRSIPDWRKLEEEFCRETYDYQFKEFSNEVRRILEGEHFYYERMWWLYTDIPTSTQRKLAKELGLSLSVVNHALKRVREIIIKNRHKLQELWNEIPNEE